MVSNLKVLLEYQNVEHRKNPSYLHVPILIKQQSDGIQNKKGEVYTTLMYELDSKINNISAYVREEEVTQCLKHINSSAYNQNNSPYSCTLGIDMNKHPNHSLIYLYEISARNNNILKTTNNTTFSTSIIRATFNDLDINETNSQTIPKVLKLIRIVHGYFSITDDANYTKDIFQSPNAPKYNERTFCYPTLRLLGVCMRLKYMKYTQPPKALLKELFELDEDRDERLFDVEDGILSKIFRILDGYTDLVKMHRDLESYPDITRPYISNRIANINLIEVADSYKFLGANMEKIKEIYNYHFSKENTTMKVGMDEICEIIWKFKNMVFNTYLEYDNISNKPDSEKICKLLHKIHLYNYVIIPLLISTALSIQ